MENKELTAAGNALISWFNSQEIRSADAEHIMLKVMAKLIIDRTRNTHPDSISDELDDHNRLLGIELVNRIYANRRKRR